MFRIQFKHLQQLLLILLLLVLPSNLFLKFGANTAYVNGLFVDYLLPKLYLTDLLIGGLLATWAAEKLLTGKFQLKLPAFSWILGLSLVMVSRQVFSPNPIASIWYLAKIIEMGLLGAFLITHHQLFSRAAWQKILGSSLLLHSALASYQFFTQTNFFPSYVWLGEPRFATPFGLAHVAWNGVERVLPYGISAHPNILGGFLSLGLLAVWWLQDRRRPNWWLVLLSLFTLLAIFFTNSVSAWLSLGIGAVVIWRPRWLARTAQLWAGVGLALFLVGIPLSLHLLSSSWPDSTSLVRRDQLTQAALEMFSRQPGWGAGLNAFTTQLETVHPSQELVRFVQPAHHLFYSWLAETGALGVAWLVVGGLWLRQKLALQMQPVVAVGWMVLPIAALDHYLLTQQTGQLLLVLSLVTVYLLSSSTGIHTTDPTSRRTAS